MDDVWQPVRGDPGRRSSGRVTIAELKSAVLRAVDARQDEIVGIARQIYASPELGFKETATSRLVAEYLKAIGSRVETDLALTGVKAVLEEFGNLLSADWGERPSGDLP